MPTVLLVYVKGGPGSGNWGHAGRPGLRGGSAPTRRTMATVASAGQQADKPKRDTEQQHRYEMAREWLAKSYGWGSNRLSVCKGGKTEKADEATLNKVAEVMSQHEQLETIITAGQRIGLSNIIVASGQKDFAELWVRYGGTGATAAEAKGVAAFFNKDYHTIVIRGLNSKAQTSYFHHEMGHALYSRAGTQARVVWNRAYRDYKFDRHTAYSKTDYEEGFAESYASYVATGGVSASARYQNTYNVIGQMVGKLR